MVCRVLRAGRKAAESEQGAELVGETEQSEEGSPRVWVY